MLAVRPAGGLELHAKPATAAGLVPRACLTSAYIHTPTRAIGRAVLSSQRPIRAAPACTGDHAGFLARTPRHHRAKKHLLTTAAAAAAGAPDRGSDAGPSEATTSSALATGTADDVDARVPQRNTEARMHSSTWASMLLELPLELAAFGSRTNPYWLRKRKRSQWWSKGHFPKIPADSLQELEQKLPEPFTLWRKLLALGLIFFCGSFNLTILQNLKDSIVVTTAGAETLPYLSAFGVLPASLLFFMLYNKIIAKLPNKWVFASTVAPLTAFYALFAVVLYPMSAVLHPQQMAAAILPHIPVGLHGLVKMFEVWTYSLFFCSAELWGAVVISVLAWSLANEVCTVQEAKTVYPLVGIAANCALVVAGNFMKLVNRTVIQGSQLRALRILVGTVVGMTGVMVLTKAYVDARVPRPPPKADKAPSSSKHKKKKKKGSLGESIQTLRGSSMIMNLATLVVAYGVSHRLFDFAWKGQLRALYPSTQAYQGVLADVSICTGYCTIALMLGGRFIFQFFGWRVAAALTPLLMLVSGGAFFAFSLFGGTMGGAAAASTGAAAGAVTQVVARSAKFSLFDPAKEMVYIEMDREEKQQGKAAVDLVGSQIGKSGGAWITQALLLGLGSISAALPVISLCFAGVVVAWLRAVGKLGQQMQEHDRIALEQAAAEKAEAEAAAAAEATWQLASTAVGIVSCPWPQTKTEKHQLSPGKLRPKYKAPPASSRWPGSVTDALGDDDDDEDLDPAGRLGAAFFAATSSNSSKMKRGRNGVANFRSGFVPGQKVLSKSSHWWKDDTPSNGAAANGKAGAKFDSNGKLVSEGAANGNGQAPSNGSLKNGVSSASGPGEGVLPATTASRS
ncbi:hypothetical protein WJX73_008976 [Symbiochloris irregularis]|uniref:ADP,ATP carrier protein n=1 Tax=Symbiochloris irregularis TaxID=706552 RepID=A0AAW1PV34_9CHLO